MEVSDINAFAANSDKYAEESQNSYSIISANGFKTDAIRIANARKDIEFLGLNDLEAEK